jgi:hypothetical protein
MADQIGSTTDPVLLLRRSLDELEFVLTARGYLYLTMVIWSASWA